MATTTNYGWTTPDDTALVKDGASAIRTLGSSVDTTTKNLNPETTLGDLSFRSSTSNVNTRIPIGSSGQHLTVVAGVPAWATASDQTPLTTKGDLFTFSTLDARLGVGANNTVLTADSAEATGLKWATPAGGGKVLQVVQGTTNTQVQNSTKTPADTGLTATITPSSVSSKVLVLINQGGCYKTAGNADNGLKLRLLKNGTNLGTIGNMVCWTNTTLANVVGSVSWDYLDSPASTSALTYKTDMLQGLTTTAAVGVQYDSDNQSSITLIEIGA